jgi:hypothetical protein
MPDSPRTPTEQSPETHEPIAVSSVSAPVTPARTEIARTRKIKPSRRRWLWLSLSVLLLLGLGAYFLWPKITGTKSGGAASKESTVGPSRTRPLIAAVRRKGQVSS